MSKLINVASIYQVAKDAGIYQTVMAGVIYHLENVCIIKCIFGATCLFLVCFAKLIRATLKLYLAP